MKEQYQIINNHTLTALPEKSGELIFLSLPEGHRFCSESKSLTRFQLYDMGKNLSLLGERPECELVHITERGESVSQTDIMYHTGTRGSGRHSKPEVRNEGQKEHRTKNIQHQTLNGLERKSSLEGGADRMGGGGCWFWGQLSMKMERIAHSPNTSHNKSGTADLLISPQGETLSLLNKTVQSFGNFMTIIKEPFAPSRLILLLILLLISFSTHAQTITQYQQEAAENNPELKAKYQQYLSALEERPITGSLPDPEVSFSYFIRPIETRLGPQQGRISISQMLPWFGSLNNQRSASDLRAKARFESFQEARNQLFYQAEVTLLELYELEHSIRIAEENLEILTSLVDLSLSRYETDRATQVDVLRAQIEKEDLIIQIELLKDNRRVLVQKMNELLNRPEGSEIQVPDSLEEAELKPKEELMVQIQQQNPNLNRLRYQEESAKEMRSFAEKQNKPGFKIGVDYIFTGETDMPGVNDSGKDALMVMAGFKVPLFRNKNNAKVQQAERNIEDVRYQISSRENNLETELTSSLRDYDDARRRFDLYDIKQIQRITQAIDIMMESYASDSSDFEEILRMQRKQLKYQLKRIQAKTDQHKAAAYIRYLSGEHNVSEEEV